MIEALLTFGAVSAVVIGGVTIARLGSKGFHAYLELRERERLTGTDKSQLEAKQAALERQMSELKTLVANRR